MGKPYSQELDAFPATYAWAGRQDVTNLGRFLGRWSGDHVAVVGSGGSYSAAKIVALFRELAHHAVTTAHTPLEFISLVGRLSPRIFFLSAEGKNKDILAGLSAAANADLAACALTLTLVNPLVAVSEKTGTPRVFPFDMDWIKDGYLATNSLLATVLLLYRVFFGDEDFQRELGPLFSSERLNARRAHIGIFRDAVEPDTGALLVLHSAEASPFAVDLASKLVEAALMPVQVADLRQFAHGQHLQLANPATSPVVIIAYAKAERQLALATRDLLPSTVAATCLEIEGATGQDIAVAGLIDAMFLAEAIASHASYDIGNPDVPDFGRAIHQLDPRAQIGARAISIPFLDRAARRKGQAGPSPSSRVSVRVQQAASDYLKRLTSASIKAVVCDFDGTLCRAEDRFDPMGGTLAALLSNLVRSGLKVAIATGRGGSLQETVAASIDTELLPQITVGYYSGALITTLGQVIDPPAGNEEFGELAAWLENTVYSDLCKSLSDAARLGQFTVRVRGPAQSAKLLTTVRAWINRTHRKTWRAYASGHSVDVLDDKTSKRLVVEHMARTFGLDPLTEILRIGDCGHEDGNDYELLSEGLSLSCDSVSGDLDTCWNYGPKGNNQAETTIAYLRSLIPGSDGFRLSESMLLAHDEVVS